MKFPVILIVILICLSCKEENGIKHPTQTVIKNDEERNVVYKVRDTLENLLQKAISKDSVNFDNWSPFISFKSGDFISKEKKNAIIATMANDSILKVELYELKGKWIKNSELTFSKALIIQFDLRMIDYDFDGSNDIYIQQSASNGFSISRGFLITIDPVTQHMKYHPEARELGNMRPEPNEGVVYSDKYNDCPYIKGKPCIVFNKWQGDKLTTTKTVCPECDELK